jgi:hypothetical protein
MNDGRITTMYHVAIDTPNGRWLQADFSLKADMETWLLKELEFLRLRWGSQEWFKVRVETWNDGR